MHDHFYFMIAVIAAANNVQTEIDLGRSIDPCGIHVYPPFVCCCVTIQAPFPHSHFEHFVFFLAFGKAKNAHMWRGSPIRLLMYENQNLLRASTTIH